MARRKSKDIVFVLPQIDYDPATEYIVFKDNIKYLDSDFVSGNFLIDMEYIQNKDLQFVQFKNHANYTLFGCGVGEHIALNVPYGWNSFADIPRKGRRKNTVKGITEDKYGHHGMGRYYGDAIDANSQSRVMYLEFGVPHFQSMISFFTNAISWREAVIATEGRSPMAYDIGKGIGLAGQIIAFPVMATVYYLGTYVLKMWFGPSDPRFYTFKPTMANYLFAANNIFKSLLIERGLLRLIPESDAEKKSKDNYGAPMKFSGSDLEQLKEVMPEIFNRDGQIDLIYIVSKIQLQVDQVYKADRKAMLSNNDDMATVGDPETGTIEEFFKRVFRIKAYQANMDEDGRKKVENQEVPQVETSVDPKEYTKPHDGQFKRLPHDKGSWFKQWKETASVGRNLGFEHIALYVDYIESGTYTVSNSVKDIPAKSILNSIGGASRDIRFSLSGGNVINDVVDEVVKGVRDMAVGTLETLSFGLSNVIAGLFYGGQLSFPKMWADSSFDVPKHSFSMTLGGPYGNTLSQVMDIDIPLAFILAGALPLGVGRSSYTSPFLVRGFLRGVIDIDFGMITNLSISIATGNVGRNNSGSSLMLKVDFDVADFTDVVTARGYDGITGAYSLRMDEYSGLNRFIRTIAGRSFRNSRYLGKDFKYRVAALKSNIVDIIDPAHIAVRGSESIVGEVFKIGNIPKNAGIIFGDY